MKESKPIGPQARRNRTQKNTLVPMLAIASILGGLQAATQYLAHVFHHAPV